MYGELDGDDGSSGFIDRRADFPIAKEATLSEEVREKETFRDVRH